MTSKADYIVKVSGVSGNFQTFTGGEGTSEAVRDWPGGATKPVLSGGPVEFGNITVERTFNAATDRAWVDQLRREISLGRFTVSKQPTDVRKIAIGKPIVYPDCLLVGMTEPEVETGTGDKGKISLEFATTGPA
jgi:hypothetical protein